MCNTPRYSESGACLGVQRCEEYVLLASDRDRLAGVVAGLEEQNARNIEALRRAEESAQFYGNRAGLLEAENARLREVLKELHTLVWGECPSLLNEDSGGDSRLDLEIEDCLGNALKEVG